MQALCNPILHNGKFLLGFSGGADSVALFFYLLEKHIDFDIAIVDYGVRTQSKEEIAYAKELATLHDKQCFQTKAPIFSSNFEAQARQFRYKFFSTLIARYSYSGLLLAHNFNDRIEWLLLRLGKGSGIAGLLGFEEIAWYYPQSTQETPKSTPYPIIRPLLWCYKQDILNYCTSRGLKFFVDSTNTNPAYERNFIRTHFATELIQRYGKGLQQSLKILSKEKDSLYQGGFFLTKHSYFIGIYAFDTHQAIHHIANALKTQGYVLSSKQREEILRTHFSCEIYTASKQQASQNPPFTHTKTQQKARFCIEHFPSTSYPFAILITKYTSITLPKQVKDQFRKLHIPKRLRPSLYAYSLQESLSLAQCKERIANAFISPVT